MKRQNALLLLGGVLVAALLSPYRFRVSRFARALPGLAAPLRTVQLSDLHFGRFMGVKSVRAWVSATVREAPDLIVITGDFLDAAVGAARRADLLRELRHLRAPLGVYAVWGNHDHASTGGGAALQDFGRELCGVGVRVLVNEQVRLRPDLSLAGIDDWWLGRPDLSRALSKGSEGALILLSHNPDVLPEVPQEVALTLSGHTHGGQVVLPLIGPPHTGSRYGTRFAGGWVNAPALGFVSRGLGVTFVPLRWGSSPELVVLDLKPSG